MSTQVQFRRGTTTQNNAFTGAQGELSVDTDLKTIRLHDGTTAGGGSTMLNNVSAQTALNKTFSTGSVWQGNAVALAYGGTGSALTAAAGAVPYSTSSGLALNSPGTSGQILVSGGTGAPTWVAGSSLSVGTATLATTATNIAGGSAGQLIIQSDTSLSTFITAGSSGTFLRSAGAGYAPTWATADVTIGSTVIALGSSSTSLDGLNILTATGTSNWKIPVGTTGQRPVTPATGMIRYNSTISSFEGYAASAWASLGGVKSVDGFTYIQAETSASASNGDLDFYAEDAAGTAATQVGQWNRTNLKDYTGTIVGTQTTQNVFNTTATTLNIGGAATTVSIGAATGTLTINNANTVITGNLTVNGTTTTVNSTVVNVDDIMIELGAVASPTDTTANGGGITLLGATNKTITWDSTNSNWTSNQDWNIATGKVFKINNTSVLSSTTLGSGVTGSSLTSVGTIGTGVWQGTLIGSTYGGTGVNNGSNTLTLAGNVSHAGAFTQTFTATANTSVTLPTTGTLATLAGSETLTNKTLTSPTLTTPTLGVATATSINGLSISTTTGTLTLVNGSTLATAGAFSTTLTATAATNVTLPTTGTLATLAGSETFTNKTLTSPTMTTPTLGVASATSINKVAITAPATSSTLTIADGKTLTASNTLTFTGTDASSVAFGAGGTVAYTNVATLSSLTSVGTIGTGVWQGTLIGSTYGGTGVNNGSSTLTMAGSVTHAGAFTQSFTATANTAVTLPTTGTLATLAGSETLTNKTLTSPTLTTPTLGVASATSINKVAITAPATGSTLTIADGKTLTASNTLTFTGTDASSVAFGAGGTVLYSGGALSAASLTLSGDLTVNGTTTTINSTTITVDDKNIELGSVASPTDVTADGGGITLKGATDKTFNWVSATAAWTSSEDLNLLTGKVYEINGTQVLSGTTLGSGVTGSSLTSVGTIATGVWNGTVITGQYGGTGVANTGKTITLGGNLTTSGAFATTLTATATTSVTLPTTGTLATLAGTETFTNKTLTSPVIATIVNTGTLTLPTSTDTLVGRATTDTLTNKTISAGVITGTLTAGGGVGTSGQFLTSTGSGVSWSSLTRNIIVGTRSSPVTIAATSGSVTVYGRSANTTVALSL